LAFREDLIYLDPPWNSNRDYNVVIFRDEPGRSSDAQLFAFEDTWHWGPTPAATYDHLTNTGEHRGRVPSGVSTLVGALHSAIGRDLVLTRSDGRFP
jgi:site-specific DNA-methyltransferase (adenine-specific)